MEFPLLSELPEITQKLQKEPEILVKTPQIPSNSVKFCQIFVFDHL